MDIVAVATEAIAAGAALGLSETASAAVRDAYAAFKQALRGICRMDSVSLLEGDPTKQLYRDAVREELTQHRTRLVEEAILANLEALRQALAAEPPERLAAAGIDIDVLKVRGNLTIERVAGGIAGNEWNVDGDVRFADIGGGRLPGKT